MFQCGISTGVLLCQIQKIKKFKNHHVKPEVFAVTVKKITFIFQSLELLRWLLFYRTKGKYFKCQNIHAGYDLR